MRGMKNQIGILRQLYPEGFQEMGLMAILISVHQTALTAAFNGHLCRQCQGQGLAKCHNGCDRLVARIFTTRPGI
jgi:hypothetical protein